MINLKGKKKEKKSKNPQNIKNPIQPASFSLN